MPKRKTAGKKPRINLRADGPYAAGDDREIAKDLGITVKQLRYDRYKQELDDYEDLRRHDALGLND